MTDRGPEQRERALTELLRAADREYQEGFVERVEDCDAGDGWSVSYGWSLWVTNEHCAVRPHVGETIRVYGRGIGYPVRGIVIGGRVYRYRTAAQEAEYQRQEAEQQKAQKRAAFERRRGELDAEYAALPPEFRKRFDQFRAVRGDEWRVEFESYELFCCKQAIEIARSVRPEAMKEFYDMPVEAQRALVPGLSDEHSGNTFGVACNLAVVYQQSPRELYKVRGALSPLCGSEEYGDYSVHPNALGEGGG